MRLAIALVFLATIALPAANEPQPAGANLIETARFSCPECIWETSSSGRRNTEKRGALDRIKFPPEHLLITMRKRPGSSPTTGDAKRKNGSRPRIECLMQMRARISRVCSLTSAG